MIICKNPNIFILFITVFLLIGCDPVRTTSQPVLLKVQDAQTGKPITEVKVSMKYDYKSNVPPEEQAENEKQIPTYQWFSDLTDPNGIANVGIEWTMIDRTLGSNPPSWRDLVTGKYYQIELDKDQQQEEFSVRINPGETVKGQYFEVHILDIKKPKYIKTK